MKQVIVAFGIFLLSSMAWAETPMRIAPEASSSALTAPAPVTLLADQPVTKAASPVVAEVLVSATVSVELKHEVLLEVPAITSRVRITRSQRLLRE